MRLERVLPPPPPPLTQGRAWGGGVVVAPGAPLPGGPDASRRTPPPAPPRKDGEGRAARREFRHPRRPTDALPRAASSPPPRGPSVRPIPRAYDCGP